MSGRNGACTPEQQSRRITNHREAATTVGSNHDGRTYQHSLTTVLHNLSHDHQHSHRRCQIIKVGRDDKCSEGDRPEQTLGVSGLDPLRDKVEAAVIVQDLNDTHRSQQEHHDTCRTTHIIEEHLIIDKVLHSVARRLITCQKSQVFHCVVSHHVISTVADIDHPTDSANEDSDGRFVHTRQVSSGNHQVAQKK